MSLEKDPITARVDKFLVPGNYTFVTFETNIIYFMLCAMPSKRLIIFPAIET